METLRKEVANYDPEDTYDWDQTGLYWRRLGSSSLSTGPRAGGKLWKARILVGMAINITGSDKTPLWLVGRAKVPRALRGFNWDAYQNV